MSHTVAVQLYSFNKEFSQGIPALLKKISDIGFSSVEFCGGITMPAEALNRLLSDCNLKLISWHFNIDDFIADYDNMLAYHKAVGNKEIVIPWYKLDTMDEIKALADKINGFAPKLREAGLRLSYHNHSGEFNKIEGRYILDILLELCKDNLFSQLDVYWAAAGGVDPARFIRAHRDSISLLHIKDGHGQGNFSPLGEGIVDIPSILAAAEECGIETLIVENDNPIPDAQSDLSKSLDYLKTLI